MFDFITELVDGSPISYGVIALFVCIDAFFPVVPGETLIITGSVLAVEGELLIWLVFLSGWVGSMTGDNITYWLGRGVGTRLRRRLFDSEKSIHRLAWAEHQLDERGAPIILAARFIPGGRTATMFAAGSLEMPWKKFLVIDVLAGALWAAYATALGVVGGSAFAESLWKPLAAALVMAALVSGAGELYRRFRMDDGGDDIERREQRLREESEELDDGDGHEHGS